ncbi:hypothetical protein ACOME3_003292 [Neoechinorhynchus agilis]
MRYYRLKRRQRGAEIRRLSSVSNLRAKQLAVLSRNTYGQAEAERIEHFDVEQRPWKLRDLKNDELLLGNDR